MMFENTPGTAAVLTVSTWLQRNDTISISEKVIVSEEGCGNIVT